jgi:hypothetical protein
MVDVCLLIRVAWGLLNLASLAMRHLITNWQSLVVCTISAVLQNYISHINSKLNVFVVRNLNAVHRNN